METDRTDNPALHAARSAWGWILAYGLIVIAIGVLALLNPVATGFAAGFLLAIMLIVYGISAIVSGFSAFAHRGRWVEILLGLLALAAGIALLFIPLAGAASIVWMLGFWLFAAGIVEIVSAIQGTHDKGWRLFLGILDVILGAILFLSSPETSLLYLAFIIAASFLFRGVFLITLALATRQATRAL
ncbi:hypothetical protein NT2_02_03810 [Caenibius tardaugens NBRC 16725]|uniref:HdeD family acid-resistance protein n=1 Tax=Caenibius tardaugens NBRC 16725 TaxID=1219035 RepID=U2ZSG6_9SPHN|nr:DUF308 domain-containing protein [Caenibius tardaugens]AZI34779.1 hypothetical protein EGO55_01445 [Caenibius tardaugens NBRC 16725]GAD48299.1 hypothetical protein NT2_02_03810 [Caenibius tardaugens NBRC 16725]